MKLTIYQVDAFTDQTFGGNPACVVPLDHWLDKEILLKIAQENAVAETAFFIKGSDTMELKWFTPEIEMDLCGHATLATAHVLFEESGIDKSEVSFSTKSGILKVDKVGDLLQMELPSRPALTATLPEIIAKGLNIQPKEVYKARDYLLVYNSEEEIQRLEPNEAQINQLNLDPGGIIVTAPAKDDGVDFVSRFFTPQASIFEDPVTGSAHCTLVPFWANVLKKNELEALQISKRVGKLTCRLKNDKVLLLGKAVTYLKGQIITIRNLD